MDSIFRPLDPELEERARQVEFSNLYGIIPDVNSNYVRDQSSSSQLYQQEYYQNRINYNGNDANMMNTDLFFDQLNSTRHSKYTRMNLMVMMMNKYL